MKQQRLLPIVRVGLDRAQEVGGAALELVSRTAWTAHLRD